MGLIKLRVEVADTDVLTHTYITLPCNLKQEVDTSHDLQITDWDSIISIGYDDIVELNEAIDKMNAENPMLSLSLLEKIMEASGVHSLDDKELQRKICDSDYLLEKLDDDALTGFSDNREGCAWFLSAKMGIPFAKNISNDFLTNIQTDKINWIKVWEYYSKMGFRIIKCNEAIYVFHWGNAEN